MSLPLWDLNMRAETLANSREECLSLRAKGAKGGKPKWDEIEAVRPASASTTMCTWSELVRDCGPLFEA